MSSGTVATDAVSFGGTARAGEDYSGAAQAFGQTFFTNNSVSVTRTITDDTIAEDDETITLAVPTFTYAGPDTVTRGDPLTITIPLNDGYTPPVVTPDPGPVTPPVTPDPATDDPIARTARVEAPAANVGRGVGQLAAGAVGERLHFDNVNTFNLAPAATVDELLRQTSFSLAHGDGGFNFWGGGNYISAEGDNNGITYGGDTTAFHLGVDTGWNNGLLGIAISRSDGDMDFNNNTDTLETEVTSVHPYLTRKFTNVQLWTTVGYGTGDAEIKEDGATTIKTDLTVTTAALGLTHARDDLLAVRLGALYNRARLDAAAGLPAVTVDTLRLNAAAELAGRRPDAWRPFLTVNLRRDFGDGDEGTAGALGGGLEWHSPTVNLRLEGSKYLTGSGAEEERINFTARKTTGRLNLGLTIGMEDEINTANLLSGEWRF